jgi:hypothetical protein
MNEAHSRHETLRHEKIAFVSNLNGTSLNDLVLLISTFPMINFFAVLLKLFLLFTYDLSTNKSNEQKKNSSGKYIFW